MPQIKKQLGLEYLKPRATFVLNNEDASGPLLSNMPIGNWGRI